MRYVNDIIQQHKYALFNNVLSEIDNINSKIKFTLEVKQNGTIPYWMYYYSKRTMEQNCLLKTKRQSLHCPT